MRINPFAGCSEEEMLILEDMKEVEKDTSEIKDIWVTKDGTKIPVNKLSRAHINNIVNYFGTLRLELHGYSNIVEMYKKFQNEKII